MCIFYCNRQGVRSGTPNNTLSVISGFRCDVEEMCAFLSCYAASSGHLSPTFQDNVSVPSPKVKKSKESVLLRWTSSPVKMDGYVVPKHR
jgi:hypothetical protein